MGALTFGGGLTMIAFMQEQVVSQFHWLTPQEFTLCPPDVFAIATLVATVVLLVWRVATLKIMLPGAVLGIARSRLLSLPGAKAVLSTVTPA